MGIDVEKELVDLANHYITRHTLENRITYKLVDPGPLPFPDETFDAVFSKDAIIHIQDKHGLYSEAFRVIRTGGRIFVSDWLRGEGNEFDNTVERFAEASGHDFTLVPLREIEEVLRNLGFVDIDLTDRQDWYLNEATAELGKMRGSLQEQLCEEIEFWEIMVSALNEGAIMPGPIRAMKPPGTH